MTTELDVVAIAVFAFFFILVTVMGFMAARWQRGETMAHIDEWGLGGRRFGTWVTWFLVGGDFYTAYTVIAVPALVWGTGAPGFFALPYTIVVYPLVFLAMPRLWAVSHRHGYVTPADFVRGRYGSHWLALAVAVTGLLATMPYIALQLVGMQVVIAALGFTNEGFVGEMPLIAAFVILAIYTYSSGLRAPAMIAFVKDAMIYIVVLVAVILVPWKLGGFGAIFDAAARELPTRTPPADLILQPKSYWAYASLALGSALAAFMYPHTITGVLSSQSGDVIRRNAALLPAYTFLLGLIALLGYMAIAAGATADNPSGIVPALFLKLFPDWFVGFAFAAVAIGALVPAAIMSIAAANLFTRNIWREYVDPDVAPGAEARIAKLTSLVVKFGALVFVLGVPTQYAITLQLLGGIWILQTFPSIVFGLWTRWFHPAALLAGWLAGMGWGTWMAADLGFKTAVYPLHWGDASISLYAALAAFAANVVVAAVLTPVCAALGFRRGSDETAAADYEASAPEPAPVSAARIAASPSR
jgi:solute:Na+ symporter, SSS family